MECLASGGVLLRWGQVAQLHGRPERRWPLRWAGDDGARCPARPPGPAARRWPRGRGGRSAGQPRRGTLGNHVALQALAGSCAGADALLEGRIRPRRAQGPARCFGLAGQVRLLRRGAVQVVLGGRRSVAAAARAGGSARGAPRPGSSGYGPGLRGPAGRPGRLPALTGQGQALHRTAAAWSARRSTASRSSAAPRASRLSCWAPTRAGSRPTSGHRLRGGSAAGRVRVLRLRPAKLAGSATGLPPRGRARRPRRRRAVLGGWRVGPSSRGRRVARPDSAAPLSRSRVRCKRGLSRAVIPP